MRTLVFGCLLAMAAVGAQPIGASACDAPTALSAEQQASYAIAMDLFRHQRYPAAYGRFARLADDGHAPSAQIALLMYRNGPTLFGSDWDASPEQIEHWRALVVDGERVQGDDLAT